jgi:rhodanese-related sulfurtransferase
MVQRRAAKTVDDLLAHARAALPGRPSPAEALRAQADGALLIDIRGDDQRRKDGLIPGAIVLPRNSLEWRCDPASKWRHPAITRRDLRIILICDQGYQSTLAAATLQQLGLIHATDLDGGFSAWAAAGLPVIAPAPADDEPPGRHPNDQLTKQLRSITGGGRSLSVAVRCEVEAVHAVGKLCPGPNRQFAVHPGQIGFYGQPCTCRHADHPDLHGRPSARSPFRSCA